MIKVNYVYMYVLLLTLSQDIMIQINKKEINRKLQNTTTE